MKLIVGLGNPGEKYEKTRHNLGFMVIDRFFKDFAPVEKTVWENQNKFKSETAAIDWQPKKGKLERVILAKPKTYMNNSGIAVQLLASFFKLPSSDIWIVNDDIDLPLGAMKIRFGGASAGHRGVESIIASLGSDKFWRFRMGIGIRNEKLTLRLRSGREIKNQKVKNVEDYVLGNFTGQERGKVKELIKRGVRALETALEKGMEAAMNRFNTK